MFLFSTVPISRHFRRIVWLVPLSPCNGNHNPKRERGTVPRRLFNGKPKATAFQNTAFGLPLNECSIVRYFETHFTEHFLQKHI